VYASGGMGVPLSLGVLSGDAGERVVYGDSRGSAVLLLCGSRELPPRDLISTETHKVSRHGGVSRSTFEVMPVTASERDARVAKGLE
jgi:hypothetical protein